jgi:hypothetical protein
MRRWLSVCLCLTVAPYRLLFAQEQREAPQSSPQTATINVAAVEGDGAINSIRLRRAHEPIVRVIDSGGEPLSDATVTFLLPATGPSGSFLDGGLSFTTQTDNQGRASGRGLRPNSIAGRFSIRVTAMWRGSVGATTLVQTNAEPVIKSGHSKTIAIIAVIAGAAAGGVALAARGKSSAAAATPPPTIPAGSISAGTPTLGPPH